MDRPTLADGIGGVRFNESSGKYEITNPAQAQKCLNVIHLP